MAGLMRAEFHRLLRDRSFWLLMIVVVAAYLVMLTGGHQLEAPGSEALGGILGGRAAAAVVIASVYGGLLVGRDFESRTFSLAVGIGRSRAAVLLSKAVAFFVAFDALVLVFPLLAVIWCAVRNGWGGPLVAPAVLSVLGTFGALSLLGASIAAVSLLAACCFRSPGPTVGIPVAIALVQMPLLNGDWAFRAAHVLPFCGTWFVGNGSIPPSYGAALGAVWCACLLTASALVISKAELR